MSRSSDATDKALRSLLAGCSTASSSLGSRLRVPLTDGPDAARPRTLDVVALSQPVNGWPVGTRGTLIDSLSKTHGLVEVTPADSLETFVAPYSALTVVWSSPRNVEQL